MFFAAISDIADLASIVALAVCGVKIMLSSFLNFFIAVGVHPNFGSHSHTSIAAP